MYYWKNNLILDSTDAAILHQLGITKMYFKYMDIDWSPVHHAYPSVTTYIKTDWLAHEMVPVLFITNRTMQNISAAEVPQLATKIWNHLLHAAKDGLTFKEIQLDCDWTESSKTNYFNLVKELKKISRLPISSTIRLYQYKYPEKAGVPPADRGMLMCYNIDDIKNSKIENSIFTPDEAEKYLSDAGKYPLDLDIALPCFSWGVLFRQGKFVTILDELDENNIYQLTYLQPTGNNGYTINKDTVLTRPGSFDEIYLREGDYIRLEQITPEVFMKAAQLAHPALNNKTPAVAFFSYDTSVINTFSKHPYEEVYNSYIW